MTFTGVVSVIIPVYQVSEYVERCIRSVMDQTYTAIECIIVDDATRDDSISKCERLIDAYKGPIRFRIIHHEQNRGLSASRNTGTNTAEGEYLYYLDSDDYIAPNCIERLTAAVQEDPSIEMVQGNCLMITEGGESQLGKITQPVRATNNNEVREEFFKNRNIYISVWNRLLKKSFVEEYGLLCREGLVFEDLLWVFYLMKHVNKAYLCKETTYYYCLRSGSILVEANPESLKCYVTSFNEILNNLTEGHEREEIEGYLYYFIKRYISYVKIVPVFNETIRLYKTRAWEYHCWKAYVVLSLMRHLGRLGNPSKLLEKMNNIRWAHKNG